MDSVKQLELIRDAHGDPALLALATVDLTYSDIPSAERIALRTALEAAAVPHWCDAGVLAGLIDDSGSLSHGQWARLKALPVVESFPARGVDAGNVHEASRLAIRKYLAETQPTRFIDLSARSARVFEADTRPVGRIEWIYHLLVADPERGASELEDLNRAWSVSARHQDLAALSAALTELETSRMLQGRPLVRVRLVVAQRRADLEGATSLGDLANQLLQAAEAIDDSPLAGDAYSLIGDVALARGDLAAAEQAFAQDLAIVERLTALDPSNTGWQQNLAVVHSRVGEVALARGDVAAAEQAFARSLAIFERLTALDPGNTGWQRNLAGAHSRVGSVTLARDDLAAAEQAFARSLAIFERLTALDPGNTVWQRDLAVAHSRVGEVALARGDLAAAEQAFAQDLAIFERLTALDPGNTGWQRDLAIAHSRVGNVTLARGDLAAAEQAFAQDLAIFERLTALDPGNTGWQRDLAIAHSRVGNVTLARDDLAATEQAFARSLAIFERLTALDPGNTVWQQNLAVVHSRVGDVALAQGDLAAAGQAFAQDLEIFERLTALDPGNTGWQQNLAVAHSRIGEVALARDDLAAAEQAFAQNPAIFEETQTWLRDHPGQTGERRALLAFVQAAAAASPHDSQSLPEPNPAELRASVGAKAAEYAVGDVIDGRFEILEILGRGSFSKVYRVRDAVEDEERALKLFDNAAGYAAVRREIGALRKIHNPNVVEVFWADKTSAGDWYLVTEFVVGESLDELVTREEAPSRPGSD